MRGNCIKNNNLDELLECDKYIESIPRIDLSGKIDVQITFSRIHAKRFLYQNKSKIHIFGSKIDNSNYFDYGNPDNIIY